MTKKLSYAAQGFILAILMLVFRILPLDAASALGGWTGRTIGPRLGATKKAYKNLALVFPEMPESEKKKIVLGMWDNIGRVISEYPHLEKIGAERLTLINEPNVKNVLEAKKGGIFFSAHIGNWETHIPGMLARYGVTASLTYRALNNPAADKILRHYRTLNGKIPAFPKVRETGRTLITELKAGRFLAILIDQKYNEGIAVNFFGRPAMTNPAFVQLAQRYDAPLVPVRCKRIKGSHFEIIAHDPLTLKDANGKNLPVEQVIAQAHKILESWIQDSPDQWLWLHRRWNSKALKDKPAA